MTIASSIPVAAPAPSTPLGPFVDSAVAWTTWVTLMGFVGIVALDLLSVGPAARRTAAASVAPASRRLAWVAVVLGILAAPAMLTDLAHDAADGVGYDYASAWDSLYDGSTAGLYSGLEVTLSLVGAVAILPLLLRRVGSGPARRWLLAAGLLTGGFALAATKLPTEAPDSRATFETIMWMLHLFGGAIWLGGVAGLLALAAPKVVETGGGFWSSAIRRFSAIAMSCVAAIGLSGLFLYWEHVDGPSQLFSTMYGRVLGVKILIFAGLLLLGMVNQFWLHPRIDALRAAGDDRPLRTIVTREFPLVIGAEVLLAMSLLFVAPFLHGSARNQAYQADLAKHTATLPETLPRLATKEASASTWVLGIIETLVVVAVMVIGYRVSGRIARNRRPGGRTLIEA